MAEHRSFPHGIIDRLKNGTLPLFALRDTPPDSNPCHTPRTDLQRHPIRHRLQTEFWLGCRKQSPGLPLYPLTQLVSYLRVLAMDDATIQ